MKSAERGLDQQISLWPLVGPFLLLASLTLLFWNVPERSLVFGLVAALSLALSWQWTWKGVAISMGLLALGFWYHAGSMDWKETLWHLGMSLALTLGFAVTALSREEIAERLLQIFPEPVVNHAEQEKLTKQLADQKSAIKSLEEQMQASREAFAQQRDHVLSLEQLLNAAREEIKTGMEEREQLQREVLQRKDSAARSLEQMAEAKEEARFLAEELKAQKAGETSAQNELKNLLQQRDHQLKLLQADLEKIQQDIRSSKAQAEGQARRAAFLEEEKQAMLRTLERERSEAQNHQQKLVDIEMQLHKAFEEKSSAITALESERKNTQSHYQKLVDTEKQIYKLSEEKNMAIIALENERKKLVNAEELLHKASDEKISAIRSLENERKKLIHAEEQLQKASEENNSLIIALENERSKLRQELADTEARAKQGANELEALQQTLGATEQRLITERDRAQQLQVQLELLQQNIAVAELQKIAHWRALRTVEGKHQQLREQFEEKSAQLNEARRERFVAEEAKESLALELEEQARYGRLIPEKPMIRHLARMEKEHAVFVANLEKEIVSLHGLIGHLFQER